MKATPMWVLSIALSTSLSAQPAEYAGKPLGWMGAFDPKAAEKSVTIDAHVYSAKQMQLARTLVGWLRQSYTPTGGIGQTFKFANEKLTLYNEHTTAQPHRYGALSRTYIDLKKGPADTWIPASNTNWFMQIAVNGVIGDRSYAITTPEQWYFYIPGEAGLSPTEREVAVLDGFPSNASLRKYISWYQPKGIATTLQFVVLLCKDNVKPYVAVTKGEYLEALGQAIERDAAAKKRAGGTMTAINTQLDRRRAAFARLKAKYKDRLSEPARTKQQPDLAIEDETSFDVFENPSYPSEYNVYKFDAARLAAARTDTPQWVVISWDAEGVANGEEAGTHLHRTMLERVNYDFIYDYVFAPEKVRGMSYRPRT
jgi:hypothetical protein